MENKICDISKETLTFLAFFDSNIIKKIPDYVIEKLSKYASDSKLDYYIDKNKKFEEQDISEESKNLISLIYYSYIAKSDEKEEILKKWNFNDNN